MAQIKIGKTTQEGELSSIEVSGHLGHVSLHIKRPREVRLSFSQEEWNRLAETVARNFARSAANSKREAETGIGSITERYPSERVTYTKPR